MQAMRWTRKEGRREGGREEGREGGRTINVNVLVGEHASHDGPDGAAQA